MDSSLSTIQVDTLVDENDGDLSAGDVSLREAIEAVEAGGTITFSQSLALTDTGAGEGVIELSQGALSIDKGLSIQGLGQDKLTVSGENQTSIFFIDSDDVVLEGLTIRDGFTAISTSGKLSVVDSLITGNSSGISNSFYYDGDRPFNTVDILVENTTIEDNRGSGIASAGTITITNSRIANNGGFGVENYSAFGGDTVVTNSIITDNSRDGIVARGGAYGIGSANVSNSTISGNGGTAITAGGGRFYAGGIIEVSDSTISGNGQGLITGDADYGSIVVNASTVSNNQGVALRSYSVSVNHSSIVGNQGTGISANDITVESSTIAQNTGSGIINKPGFYSPISTILTVNNSTISGNGSASVKAGGLEISDTYRDTYLQADVRITNTTISGNIGSTGGGVFIENYINEDGESGNQFVIGNSIIAGNLGPATDIAAEGIESLGYNLIGDGSDVTGLRDTDIVGSLSNPINPRLSALQDNGGSTLTQVPLDGSPVIDAGDPNEDDNGFDQRGEGFDRIVDGDDDGNSRIDIGAVEAAGGVSPVFHILNGNRLNNRLLGAGGHDRISGFRGNDFLKGRGSDDILLGGAGDDRLLGDSGDDILNGGQGRDKLTGGSGKDTFIYKRLHEGKDVILDFKVGQDLIDLSGILNGARYNSATPFEDYIRLGQVGLNTRLEVLNANASRGGREVFTELAVIRHIAPADLGESSFVL